MGTYVYSLRSPKLVKQVKLDTGELLSVASYAFAYKEGWGTVGRHAVWYRAFNARLTRMENIWADWLAKGNSKPKGGVFVSAEDGQPIPSARIGDSVWVWEPHKGSSSTEYRLPFTVSDGSGGYGDGKCLGKVVEIIG